MKKQLNYNQVLPFLENSYPEVDGFDFYEDIFPNNENKGEYSSDYSKPNAIYLYHNNENRLRRRIMLKDTWADDFERYVLDNPMTLCSGLAYRSYANKLTNAQQMNALIFDIDGVGEYEFKNILLRWNLPPEHIRSIPIPTYTVLSGSGLHLYYVFEEPISLYPNIKIQLKAMKHDLTFRFWDYKGTSQIKQIQYQSINQSFRMVGSINTKYDVKVRAFHTGEKFTIEQLNAYCDKPENKVDLSRPFRPSVMTKEKAKVAYPEWYQRVVIEGNKLPKKWDIAGKVNGNNPYALYDWWKDKLYDVKAGHRYFYLMCLSIYAVKCDYPKKDLRKDMLKMFDYLKSIEHSNPFTKGDIENALEIYDREYYNFTIRDIEKLSDIRIERNKRNYRSQKEHLRRARAVQEIDYPDGSWRNTKGQKIKKDIVQEWREKNPRGKKARCIRETGLSPKTVYKWWTA